MIKKMMVSAMLSAMITVAGISAGGGRLISEGSEKDAVSVWVQVPNQEAATDLNITGGTVTGGTVTEGASTEAAATELTMLANARGSQMLGVVIHSKEGKTVVIDGGCDDDGDHLLDIIKKNGGHVDAWLLTHPHSDHIGALRYLLQNKKDQIAIDKIYYSFAPLSWYEEKAPNDAPTVASIFHELSQLPQEKRWDSIKKDDQIEVGDIHIEVLNDRYQMHSDPINNSSIVYLVETGGQKILFLGDLGYDGGFQLLRDAKDKLKADVVQMAHHGQNGVDKSVYEAIAPRICLWPTPQWLWDNDKGSGYNSGSWRTIETRGWMKSLGVETNYTIKDGDIVLRLNP